MVVEWFAKMWTQILMVYLTSCILTQTLDLDQTTGMENAYDKSPKLGKPCLKQPQCKCMTIKEKQTIVTCKKSNLTEVPTELPNNTILLDLGDNDITSLDSEKFTGYPELIYLDISSNKLTELTPGAFAGLQKLRSLSLQNNSIRYNSSGFQPGIFQPLVSLQILNIQQNFTKYDYRGEDYKLEALKDLRNLSCLFLDGIPEKNLGEVFKNLTSLVELIFRHKLGTARCYLPKLTTRFFPHNTFISNVTLQHCEIKKIEAKTFKPLRHLLYLDFSYNEDLTFNSLRNITDGLLSTNIATLKLNRVHKEYGTCITITKDNIQLLKNLNLKEIYLDSNRISTLEKSAVQYIPKSLETVSIKDNSLRLDTYVAELIQRKSFPHLKKFIMSEQNKNHYISDLFHDIVSKLQNTQMELDMLLLSNSKLQETKLERINTLPQQKKISGSNEENKFYLQGKTSDHEYTNSKVVHKRHSDLYKDKKSKQYKNLTVAEKQLETDETFVALLKENLMKWIENRTILFPETLRYLDISDTKMRLILQNINLETPNNLNELYLNRNIFWAWYGPFKGYENLTKLDLSWNSCDDMNPTVFKYMFNLKTLNLSNNFLGPSIKKDKDGVIFQNQRKLERLSLNENQLRKLPENIFAGLKSLRYLHIANNLLRTFDVKLSHMNQLKEVNLYDNHLETINETTRKVFDHQALRTNFILNLENNNFRCDCGNLDFLQWIFESPVRFENIQNYICYFNNGTIGNLSDARSIFESLQKDCYNYIPIILSSTALMVLILSLTTSVVAYRYRWHLRYMYYMARHKAKRLKQRRGGYEPIDIVDEQCKDVNVSYADEESSFIRNKIYMELEVKRGLKLHIRDRDSPIAEVYENILDAIERSKKTLIILSNSYLKHRWCIFEMNMAGVKALKTGRHLLCVLLLEDVPHKDLPLKVIQIIKDQEHIEYPKEEILDDWFWDRLKTTLTE